MLKLDENSFLYLTTAEEKRLGEREERPALVLMNEKKGSKNEEAVYTGEWLKETKTRQGKGVLER